MGRRRAGAPERFRRRHPDTSGAEPAVHHRLRFPEPLQQNRSSWICSATFAPEKQQNPSCTRLTRRPVAPPPPWLRRACCCLHSGPGSGTAPFWRACELGPPRFVCLCWCACGCVEAWTGLAPTDSAVFPRSRCSRLCS
ncbi:hypothetical protein OJAV_G00124480 [Oryzias javanicus]|uniref:Uncharacterized protein n=1 Tax=Oryzias javanicus TaxID=123683 RepID=A0A3S2Q0A7_ORYJA|nr:hypothetical protein OJAV_G00124480 [Oryzias javanicus]